MKTDVPTSLRTSSIRRNTQMYLVVWLLSMLEPQGNRGRGCGGVKKPLHYLLVRAIQIKLLSENKHNLCLGKLILSDLKRKIWTWTTTQTQTSRSLAWHSTIELFWFNCQFTFKLTFWNNMPLQGGVIMTLTAIYWPLEN